MKVKEGTVFSRSYFKGYEMRPVMGQDGIVREEYIYSGPLYILDGPSSKRWINKTIHTVMWIITAFCIMLAGIQTSVINTSKVSTFPVFIIAMATVIRFFCVVFGWTAPRKMKERDYKWAVTWLRITSGISAACSFLSLVVSFSLAVIYKDFSFAALFTTFIHIPEGIASVVSFAIETKAVYRIERSM